MFDQPRYIVEARHYDSKRFLGGSLWHRRQQLAFLIRGLEAFP